MGNEDKIQATNIVNYYFPNLLTQYLAAPETMAFRYLYSNTTFDGRNRREAFGDIDKNISSYGVDFDLSQGWHAIWTRSGRIYGGGLQPGSEDTYLLIYNDPDGYLDGPGFFDEGALDFTKLVLAGKTPKNLLHEGGVLKITNSF